MQISVISGLSRSVFNGDGVVTWELRMKPEGRTRGVNHRRSRRGYSDSRLPDLLHTCTGLTESPPPLHSASSRIPTHLFNIHH